MLGKRYKFDGHPIIKLNPLQEKIKLQIGSQIKEGRYRTEKVPCAVCGGSDFEQLSEKDRHGLPLSVVICRDCGLIQTNPRMDESSYKEFYRTQYIQLNTGKDKATREYFLDRYFEGANIYRYLKNHFPKDPNNMFVVEIGCSAGGILAYFRDRGCGVMGLDIDEDSVLFGRKNYNLDLRVGSLSEQTLERPPDIIILSHVLEHFSRPNEELSAVRRAASAGTIIYIEVPGFKNLLFNFYDLDFLHSLQIPHLYFFSIITLQNLLRRNGFAMIEGDNRVRSISKTCKPEIDYRSDYRDAISYLERLETFRRYLPITPYKVRYAIESAYRWLLHKTGLYNGARKLYRRIIKRTEPKDGS